MSVFSLSGKTALVAGASRGIGLAIAQRLAEAGARTTPAPRSIDKLREHVVALEAKGFEADALRLDMADSASIRAAMDGLETRDILVNVAGMNIRKSFSEYTQAEYDHIMRTNLNGIVELTQRIGARMIARGAGGKIVMMWESAEAVGMREWLKGAQANPRLGTPDDTAPLAVFPAGCGADYITGQIIAADGGYTTTAVRPFEPGG